MIPTAANAIDRAVPQSFKTWLYNYQGGGPQAHIEALFESTTAENPAYSSVM